MGDSEIVNTPDCTRYVHHNETETPLDVRGLKKTFITRQRASNFMCQNYNQKRLGCLSGKYDNH